MTVVMIEGFDVEGTPGWPGYWEKRGWVSAGSVFSTVAGRHAGSYAVEVIPGGNQIAKVFPDGPVDPVIIGVAFYCQVPQPLVQVQTAAGGLIASVRVGYDQKIALYDRLGAYVASGTRTLDLGVYHYLEVRIDVGGNGDVHIDGVAEISGVSGNWGSTPAGRVYLDCSFDLPRMVTYDDLYVADDSDGAGFLGDVCVQTLYPDGVGTYSEWTPVGAAANYQCVDEVQPDFTTTEITTETVGARDLYTFQDLDLPGGASVYACQLNALARKNDSGTRQIKPLIRQGGVDYEGPTLTLAADWDYRSWMLDTDPSGTAWTELNVDGDEYGVKLEA
jgi:hypothetical protein